MVNRAIVAKNVISPQFQKAQILRFGWEVLIPTEDGIGKKRA